MTITTDNYELYFYRYAEGELNAQERTAVEAFAAQHPELAEELALYDPQLKLEEQPMACPNKEQLLHREAKVLPLWRWAAAACVVALLVGGVWLLWPEKEAPQQMASLRETEKVREARESMEFMEPMESIESIEPRISRKASEPRKAIVSIEPMESTESIESIESIEFMEPMETLAAEPVLLASAEPMEEVEMVEEMEPQATQEHTVIEYTDIVLVPDLVVEEVVDSAEASKVSTRWRAFRSRVNNSIRDYAYYAYAHTRGELLALADRRE